MGHVMDQQQQQQLQTKPCLNCPRCNSTNTKFCYYNNYSLSQPRHFCKACKRYWTRGGTLRNVPVGGGCKKNSKRVKRVLLSSSAPTNLPSSTSLSLLVNARPASSPNQVSTMPTSMAPATPDGPNNNVHIPTFYGLTGISSAGYNDLIQQQCCMYSAMNAGTNNDPTAPFFSSYNSHMVEFHTLQNATPTHPSSTVCTLDHKDSATSGEAASQDSLLLQNLLPFQVMKQQGQPSSTIANGHHQHHPVDPHAQRWSDHHLHQNDPSHNSTMYWSGASNVASWPHNHLTNMDG